MASMVQSCQVLVSPLAMGLALVTVWTTAGGARISVPALLISLIESGSMWSPWMSVIRIRSAFGRPGIRRFGGIEIDGLSPRLNQCAGVI